MARARRKATAAMAPALGDRKDDDGDLVLAGESEGRRIHDREISGDRLVMGQALVALRGGVALGIGGVDAVDLRGLEHGVGREFRGAQHRAACPW